MLKLLAILNRVLISHTCYWRSSGNSSLVACIQIGRLNTTLLARKVAGGFVFFIDGILCITAFGWLDAWRVLLDLIAIVSHRPYGRYCIDHFALGNPMHGKTPASLRLIEWIMCVGPQVRMATAMTDLVRVTCSLRVLGGCFWHIWLDSK